MLVKTLVFDKVDYPLIIAFNFFIARVVSINKQVDVFASGVLLLSVAIPYNNITTKSCAQRVVNKEYIAMHMQ